MIKNVVLSGLFLAPLLTGCSTLNDQPPLTTCNACSDYAGQVSRYIHDLGQNEATKSKAADVQKAYDKFSADTNKLQGNDYYNACEDALSKLPPEYQNW